MFSITPTYDEKITTGEYRFYAKKKGAPRGFYYAPYARYANYKFDFNETIEGNFSNVASRLSTYCLGIQIGTQWIIKDRFVIDWGFLGASIQQCNLKGTFTSTDSTVDFNEIRESLEMDIEDSNILNNPIEFTSGDDFLEAKLPFLFGGLRSYITIGMQF